jgi:hypothetical protein
VLHKHYSAVNTLCICDHHEGVRNSCLVCKYTAVCLSNTRHFHSVCISPPTFMMSVLSAVPQYLTMGTLQNPLAASCCCSACRRYCLDIPSSRQCVIWFNFWCHSARYLRRFTEMYTITSGTNTARVFRYEFCRCSKSSYGWVGCNFLCPQMKFCGFQT